MSFCKYCGKELAKTEEHKCPKRPAIIRFLSWLFDRSGVENPFRNRNEIYERGWDVTPDSIALDDGEIPVKQYNVGILRSRLRFQRSEGRLQLTNKRVLFRATGYSPAGKTVYQHAFALDKIDGVEIHKDRRFRFPDFLFALWWDLMSLAFSFLGASYITEGFGWGTFGQIVAAIIVASLGIGGVGYFFWKKHRFFQKLILTGLVRGGIMGLIAVIIAASLPKFVTVLSLITWGTLYLVLSVLYYVSMFLFVVKPNLMIEIKTSSGSPGIQIRHKEISFLWHKCEKFSGFTEILPWEDTDSAIREVPAIIDDIKTLGDFGVEKWKQH